MATLYFNAAVDNDWNTLGNWWADSGCTTAAAALPASADDVTINSGASVTGNSGSVPQVRSLLVNGTLYGFTVDIAFEGSVSIYGLLGDYSTGGTALTGDSYSWYVYGQAAKVTFNGDLVIYGGTITNCPVIGDVQLYEYGGISNSPFLFGGPCPITGTITFYDYSMAYELHCESDIDLYDNSMCSGYYWDLINGGNVTFHDSSMIYGDIYYAGVVTFKDTSSSSVLSWGSFGCGYFYECPVVYQDNSMVFRYRGLDPGFTQNITLLNTYYDWASGTDNATVDESAMIATMQDSMQAFGSVTYNIKRGMNGSSILGVV